MAILKAKDLRSEFLGSNRFILEQRNFSETNEYKRAEARAVNLLIEVSRNFSERTDYDIFLSHSSKDAIVIYQIYKKLTDRGLLVYVDWINDPLLNRAAVTPNTADTLRKRMRKSKSFILAHSSNSSASSWVQWELGYSDGLSSGRVAIMPIEEDGASARFHRQEYLGLYPYIDLEGTNLWVNGNEAKYFSTWLGMENPTTLIYS